MNHEHWKHLYGQELFVAPFPIKETAATAAGYWGRRFNCEVTYFSPESYIKMVKKWKIRELYAFINDASAKAFYSSKDQTIDWSEYKYMRYYKPFVLLEKPSSSFGFGKVLLTTGEVYWVALAPWQCLVVDKKWLRNNGHV